MYAKTVPTVPCLMDLLKTVNEESGCYMIVTNTLSQNENRLFYLLGTVWKILGLKLILFLSDRALIFKTNCNECL